MVPIEGGNSMADKFCPHCGQELKEGSSFCPNCGTKLDGNDNSNAGTFYQDNTWSNNENGNVVKDTSSYATSTLVFGILALCLGGLLWTILAIVFYCKSDKTDTKAKVGFILAIIGTVLWSIMLILMLARMLTIS